MKTKTSPFLFVPLLLWVFILLTCQKDENVPLDQFKIIQENISSTAKTAELKVYYVYAQNKQCKLERVNIYYSKDSEVKNPIHAKCELKEDHDGTYFIVALSGLEAKTDYYYYYEVANAINAMKTDVEKFTTDDYGLPSVTTVSVTNIIGTGARFYGNVSDGGELNVTERGFCYGTSSGNLTISGQHIVAGSGLGDFNASVSGLSTNTIYYMRAYAKNNKGVAYGNVKSFTTSNGMPAVTTGNVANISDVTATCSGNITSDGGFTVTARGVCWSTSQNPTINNSHTTDGSGTGNFSATLTGLSARTTYYVRAYATNSQGTSYGTQKSFTTLVTCPVSITDYDGNIYSATRIGNQCWMNQNLRTTHYANGVSIPLGSSASTTTAYRYYPNNSSSNVTTYGYLYNWTAVMHGASPSSSNPSNVQGICPTGWHVPSMSEWSQLTSYLSSQSQNLCNGVSANIAKSMASKTGWNSSTYGCAVGNNPSANNSSNFNAYPAGRFHSDYYGILAFGLNAHFWATDEVNIYNAQSIYIYYDRPSVEYSGYQLKDYGFSVRCVRN